MDVPYEMMNPPNPLKVWRRNNAVYFSEDCTSESIYKLKEHLMNIYSERGNSYAALIINSYGGDADTIAVYDWLKTYPLPLFTFVEGVCFSCATVLFLAGEQRFISPSSLFLIHSAHGMVMDDLKEGTARDQYEHTKEINAALRTIYSHETKLSKAQLDDLMSYKDKVMSAKMSVKWGMAHKIGIYMEGRI